MDLNSNEKKIKTIVYVSCILVIFVIFTAVKSCSRQKSEPIVMPQEQTTDTQAVKKQLGVSQNTAEKITKEIHYIQTGETQPSVTYYVQAPDLTAGAETVARDIQADKPSVPAAAREKTDRTVVTADKDHQKVDVYKVNLRKPHKIKVGAMTTGDKTYIGAGYQYGRWEGMLYTRTGKKVEAGSITYTVKEW